MLKYLRSESSFLMKISVLFVLVGVGSIAKDQKLFTTTPKNSVEISEVKKAPENDFESILTFF